LLPLGVTQRPALWCPDFPRAISEEITRGCLSGSDSLNPTE